ncbi:hypothetical protein HOY34_08380 [Xinfangfangia sp. D13-10-4-6]|uniref:hypothetical protein n=1 Tax=Pseudogemmobacter hezensis TaxID=2737662 RepID=UPI001554E50D|nr:hypothetical protein [Pseudogemmobacter hezensis]NPD15213.1 hypothetical protein [Pseudogemmobacter hezensis]
MALQPTHELHRRRLGRNVGVAGLLLAFVALVFALTVVKIQRGEPIQGFDHTAEQPRVGPAALPTNSSPNSHPGPEATP